jgi:hypothetical protein
VGVVQSITICPKFQAKHNTNICICRRNGKTQ